ncbi:MAG: hypothetical protein JNK23_10675 [Opitutaceae bacterium]|nr:hypothetical protein [Opitutaceae bacterium]
MLHILHRREVRRARAAQLTARAVNIAVAPTAGCEGSARGFAAFIREMQDIIDHDPLASPQPGEGGTTREEIAAFQRLTRGARA